VHAPEKLDDPFASYVAYLRSPMDWWKKLSLEKAGGFRDKGSPEAFEFTARRLAAGSQMLLISGTPPG